MNISDEQMSYITNARTGCGLIRYGGSIVPFVNRMPKGKLYNLNTTIPVQLPSHNNEVKSSINPTMNQFVNPNAKGKKFITQSIKIGTKVLHKAFGEGTVDSFKGDFIKITFIIDYKKVQKTLKYPAAFIQGFLA